MPATDDQLIALARQELQAPQWATTSQFLEIHALDGEAGGGPKVAGVVHLGYRTDVYFRVKGEDFFFRVYFYDYENAGPVLSGTGSAARHNVRLKVFSDIRTLQELTDLTQVPPTRGYSKGDPYGKKTAVRRHSYLLFEPDLGPGEAEWKLARLLTALEERKAALLRVPADVYCEIAIASDYHQGNQMLGGVHLSAEVLVRLAALHLDVDFDNYAWGNGYAEDTD